MGGVSLLKLTFAVLGINAVSIQNTREGFESSAGTNESTAVASPERGSANALPVGAGSENGGMDSLMDTPMDFDWVCIDLPSIRLVQRRRSALIHSVCG